MKLKFSHTKKYLRVNFKRLVYRGVSSHKVALGVALGVFVGILGPYGTHLILALALAWLFRADKLGAALGTLINSPITLIPIYSSGWALGCWALDHDAEFPTDQLRHSSQFWNFVGHDIFVPLATGLAIEAAVLSLVSYVVTKFLVTHLRRKRLHGSGRSSHKLLQTYPCPDKIHD